MGSWFSSSIFDKDFDLFIEGLNIKKNSLTKENFFNEWLRAFNDKFSENTRAEIEIKIKELSGFIEKFIDIPTKYGSNNGKQELMDFILEKSQEYSSEIDSQTERLQKILKNKPANNTANNAAANNAAAKKAAANNAAAKKASANNAAAKKASANNAAANNAAVNNADSKKASANNATAKKASANNAAANNAAVNNADSKKAAANNAASKKAAANNAVENKTPVKKAIDNNAPVNNASISPASSNLTQTTVSNTANNKPKNVTNVLVKPSSITNSESTVSNTSSTKAANNEMYSSILKKLEGLKENMEKKVNEEFQTRIAIAKPGSIVTIYQIGGISFTRLIKLFLIIQKLRNNNNNTKKLELDLKNLLKFKVIDKKSKNKPEELLEKYKTEINSKPIDVLKREFNEECKVLFQHYTEIDESEIPKLEVKNNKSANQTANQIPNKTANQTANIIKKVLNLSENTVNNKDIDSQKFLDLIKLLLLLQKIIKDESLQLYLNRLIIRCGDTCGLTELKYVNMGKRGKRGKRGINQFIVVSKEALEKFNSNSKNKSNSQLKIEINEMLKKFYKKYRESTPENEIPQINSPNNNARSNANTVVGNSNQSNLTEELNNKSKKLPLLDQPQPAITSGGSRKKSKKLSS